MEANEMEPGTWDERGQALEEFQRGHHEMGGAIAIMVLVVPESEDQPWRWVARCYVEAEQAEPDGRELTT